MKRKKWLIIALSCVLVVAIGIGVVWYAIAKTNGDQTHTHLWDEGVITTPAGCETKGVKTYTCVHGETYTEEIPATGHSHTSSVTAPTCTEQGYTTYTCSCGDTYVADYVKENGHSYTNYVSDDNATCTEDGTKTAYCDNGCGTADTVADEKSATGCSLIAII